MCLLQLYVHSVTMFMQEIYVRKDFAMKETTLTIRIDEELKMKANDVFSSLGMSMTTAINLFLRQSVIKQSFPCSLELENSADYEYTYPQEFFELFGAGKDLGLDERLSELIFQNDLRREEI